MNEYFPKQELKSIYNLLKNKNKNASRHTEIVKMLKEAQAQAQTD